MYSIRIQMQLIQQVCTSVLDAGGSLMQIQGQDHESVKKFDNFFPRWYFDIFDTFISNFWMGWFYPQEESSHSQVSYVMVVFILGKRANQAYIFNRINLLSLIVIWALCPWPVDI